MREGERERKDTLISLPRTRAGRRCASRRRHPQMYFPVGWLGLGTWLGGWARDVGLEVGV